jgi:hypothetical protein
MAYTSKYGFIYKRHLIPSTETPATLEVILANSAVMVVGDVVRWSSGYLASVTSATAPNGAMLGILVGIVTSRGENLFKTKDSLSGTKSGDDTYTAASNNTTVDKVRGVVVVDPLALFFAYSDTVLTQAYVGLWAAGKVFDGTAMDGVTGTPTTWSTGSYQFQLVELVPTLPDGTATSYGGLWRLGRTQLINDYAL